MEWSASDQTQTHGDEASKKRSGHLITDMGHHREVICTVRFSNCKPMDEDDDDQKRPREARSALRVSARGR